MVNRNGTQGWRGQIPIPPHCHPLVQELLTILNANKMTLSECGERAGLSRATMHGWRYRTNPKIDMLDAALSVHGYELKVVKKHEPAEAAYE